MATIHQPGGHIDHLPRQTRMNLIQLSSMADMKSSMLVTVSSVVLTLAAPYLRQSDLQYAAVLLAVFCLLTVILATYAAMPQTPFSVNRRAPDVNSPKFNILFFGDYAGMPYEDDLAATEEAMDGDRKTYEIQVREVYTLGTFLAKRKYRFVRLAYATFIGGLLSSAVAIVLS